jgi:hypothetical protein
LSARSRVASSETRRADCVLGAESRVRRRESERSRVGGQAGARKPGRFRHSKPVGHLRSEGALLARRDVNPNQRSIYAQVGRANSARSTGGVLIGRLASDTSPIEPPPPSSTNFLERGCSCLDTVREVDQALDRCQNGSLQLNGPALSWLLRLDDKTAPARDERRDLAA